MTTREKLQTAAHVVFGVAGIAAAVLLVRAVGYERMGELLAQALPFLPVLLVLELVRIATEAWATIALFGADARKVPTLVWIRLHLVANAACNVLPGGRAISEGIKVARLGPLVGVGRAAAIVVVQHQALLVAMALLLGAGAAWAWPGTFAWALLAQAVLSLGAAVGLRVALRKAILPGFVRRLLPGEGVVRDVRATAHMLPIVPGVAVLAKLLNRLAVAGQIALLLYALGVTPSFARAIIGHGVVALGSTLGELSPAQIGGTEGAFAAAAPLLGAGLAIAVSVATLLRVVQLVGSSAAVLGPLLVSAPRREAASAPKRGDSEPVRGPGASLV